MKKKYIPPKRSIHHIRFLELLKTELRAKGIKQDTVAKWIGLNRSQVSRMFSGFRSINLEHINIMLVKTGIAKDGDVYKKIQELM